MVFQYRAGLGNAASYMVSGRPWCKAEIDCESAPVKVEFPAVTRWIQIFNQDDAAGHHLKVAFSENGLSGDEYFALEDYVGTSEAGHNTIQLELKLTEIWIEGSDNVEIIAGLTTIGIGEINVAGVVNWSGSVGVG